jgi:heme-degrading monooxygenase HmoA
MIAKTPNSPYYAVIFTFVLTQEDLGYHKISNSMFELAKKQVGFLGVETARNGVGITVSYCKNLEAIKNWKLQEAHAVAIEKGRSTWYKAFKDRICKVERNYEFEK